MALSLEERARRIGISRLVVGSGAIGELPSILRENHAESVYLLADKNTYAAAGERVAALLTEEGISFSSFVFGGEETEPDEAAVGAAVMHCGPRTDLVLSVGSGVINDIGKILAAQRRCPYVIVGTAPSMDGYASATSSMSLDGVKISLPTKSADVIIGDLDILAAAPERLLRAGLGDMLAKYVSICEWRIASLLIGERYEPAIAASVREALALCVRNADGLLSRDPEAVRAVFEGLVLCGIAMAEAGSSRPASGVEHYFSHIWDMRHLSYGMPMDLHGAQCAVGTRLAVALYERLLAETPDRDRALAAARNFSLDAWNARLREFVGVGAESMIAREKEEGKYDRAAHAARLDRIIEVWEEICAIVREELPTVSELDALYTRIGLPMTAADLGLPAEELGDTFLATKDIRDKYVLSRLAWDLGLADTLAAFATTL